MRRTRVPTYKYVFIFCTYPRSLIPFYSYSQFVDGYDIRTINLNHLRSKIGIVNQEPALFDCSIRDNIAYGAKALNVDVTFEVIQQAAKTANIHDFIVSLPMVEILSYYE